MAEIGFYHLLSMPLERALPRLLERACAQGHRIVIRAASSERVEHLNSLFWTYDDTSFLPHGSARDGNPASQPIWLSDHAENPNAPRRNRTGAINDRFEKNGLRIVAQKRLRLSQDTAERFYAVHAQRPFYRSLVDFMISGPVVVQVLEGENAVQKNRDAMGATDPAKAAAGTIRKDFAESIEANSVHGSDSPENAAQEIAFFFSQTEICP